MKYSVEISTLFLYLCLKIHSMKPKFFSTQENFRKWLEENHLSSAEILVGFYKVGTKKLSMT